MDSASENIIYNRVVRLTGNAAFQRLQATRVVVFGLGGVGSWCAEALVRSGVQRICLVDADTVAASNINRQLPALVSTVGEPKVEVMKRRLLDINPTLEVETRCERYSAATADSFNLASFDFVIDAIDSLADKAALIVNATMVNGLHLVSSMGAALRTEPTKVRLASDFSKVGGDALAAALRRRFRKTGVWPRRRFECVWSEEQRRNNVGEEGPSDGSMGFGKAVVNGALCQVTATFGMTLAAAVVNRVIGR